MTFSKPFLAACLVLAVLFIWRYQTVETEALEKAGAITQYAGQEVQFEAKVVKAPEERFSSMHAVVQPIFATEGRILLTTQEAFLVQYGDIIQVQGILERPGTFDGFDYAKFLAKDGIYAIMRDPKVEVVQRGAYSRLGERTLAAVFALKETFRDTLEQHLSSRHSSVMVEMLLGDKDVMSDDLAQDLNATGLRHIIAISGAHIAILTMYLMPFLIWFGLWRQQAFYVTLALLIFYVVLTGLQPSAVRAGIMGGMFLLGQHLGRPYAALRALVLSAGAMLLLNPLLLTRDAGFQLSFLAVLGMILLLSPMLSLLPKKMPARQLLAMTLAAQVFTLPILIWNFGQISVVSVVTNILIVPIVPLLMGLGFALMIGGTLLSFVGLLVSFPVAVMLEYTLWVVDFFAAFPFAAVQTENFPWFWFLPFYAVVAFLHWKLRKREGFLVY
ncbi:MAG TPA: ComEC/Rec2 family competence protein [Candidatus Paceibacterota bacterium]|nr:ComEC/Rec2 family competence protein [Candidatus Paceibacterota bacterium]